MNSYAVIRADDLDKARVALCDLIRYAHLTFGGKVRKLDPAFADNILVHVLNSPLRVNCEAACIVALNDDASAAIGRIRKIHPPAHIIIVSSRYDIYYELMNYIDILPEIEFDIELDIYGRFSKREISQEVIPLEDIYKKNIAKGEG